MYRYMRDNPSAPPATVSLRPGLRKVKSNEKSRLYGRLEVLRDLSLSSRWDIRFHGTERLAPSLLRNCHTGQNRIRYDA